MRTILILLVVLLAAGAYADFKDPAGCAKLAADFVAVFNATIARPAHPRVGSDSPIDSSSASTDSASSDAQTSDAVPSPFHRVRTEAEMQTESQEITNEFDLKTIGYDDALKQAKAENKLVLLDFTGSDWCPYCQELDKEVLSQHAFQAFSVAHFVFVTLDFPRNTVLPDDVKQANDALAKQYNVHEFPTLLVADADGQELGRSAGYNPGSGPDAVISDLRPYCKP